MSCCLTLFNRLTVLCEAEDDRMIYQYAAEKYLPELAADVNFVGSNGKSGTVKNLLLLKGRELNAICILDIDILYSEELLNPLIISDPADLEQIRNLRMQLNAILSDKALKKDFRNSGVNSVNVMPLRTEIEEAISILIKYHVFVVEKGQLESWMQVRKKDVKKVQQMINSIDSKVLRSLKRFLRTCLA